MLKEKKPMLNVIFVMKKVHSPPTFRQPTQAGLLPDIQKAEILREKIGT
jgi:hypothetical protein